MKNLLKLANLLDRSGFFAVADQIDFLLKKAAVNIRDGVSNEEAIQLGHQLKVDFDQVDLEQFRKGIEVEREHADVTTDPLETAKIALVHLQELPDYYSRLSKMEKGAKYKSAANPIASNPQLMTTPMQTLIQQTPQQMGNNAAATAQTLQAMKNALNILQTSYASNPATQHAALLTKIISEIGMIPGVR